MDVCHNGRRSPPRPRLRGPGLFLTKKEAVTLSGMYLLCSAGRYRAGARWSGHFTGRLLVSPIYVEGLTLYLSSNICV